ncbi:NUDIX domain-containing protein [Streptomyces caniscabiei]|uniref:NUDIX domain-containing protein n=1 Tax=Streptomyces caniscabiei TaxID=2746961 RepID=A0A927KX37_9ACTN|nr:NUDIX domain-containing protein [Streptomyces caniscabiei]MBD9721940.1 NUDIX domain-containing protein [Streptomyces caniscabiei]MDX3509131.1 NUDIX domain-containing protein [Streptomyces caniscabiei]MDX3717116.1 NUDIX domain-containing protein [Streptomyces caniscabiei]WEO22983.1 NUDIX domain-containing protein [Streptomyces caniscabiei]
MEVISTWTGRTACALQQALRMTNDAFADHLGVGVRTVASWHATPAIVPRTEIQSALDTAYERSTPSVQRRFSLLTRPAPTAVEAQALRVAIAVVLRGDDVLLVCRRGDGELRWQFPAGMVKPGADPATVAAQETHGETGVHCRVREQLGERVHPVTGVVASYFLADHLAGDASNKDPLENVDVTWAPRTALTRFIPADQIFPPILSALEVAA